MKSNLTVLLAAGLLATSAEAQDKPDLKQEKTRTSYCIGADIGGALKRQEIDLDLKGFQAGLADALADKLALSEEEMRETMMAFQKQMMEKSQGKQKEAGAKNLKEGEVFLAANAKKEGVKVLPSGLQYKVITSGKGKSPKTTDTVKTHYHGTLVDGTVFDSSVKRGEPVTFPVNQVIPGWTEALQLMKEGDKWQLFIPSKLAYGEQPPPRSPIGPNATLIFDVELISIEKAEK